MINVLHLRDSTRTFGAERVIIGIVSSDCKENLRHTVASFVGRGVKENQFLKEISPLCNTEEICEKGSYDFNIISQFVSLIKKNNIRIVHSHDSKSNICGLIAAKIARVPIISTIHGWIRNNVKQKALVSIDIFLKRYFDKVIIVSKSQEATLVKYGVKRHNIIYIPNSVNLNEGPATPNKSSFRQEQNIKSDELLIGNVGRLSPEKGQRDLIIAAGKLKASLPKAKYVIVGDGPDKNSLERYARELSMQDRIIFTGYRDDMTNIYRSMDLFVLPSYTEGLPNVLLEAMANEVPVIATGVGGVPEVIQQNTTGYLVSPGQPNELASTIMRVTEKENDLKEIIHNSKNLIADKFSLDKNILKLHQIYFDLAS